jgi:asparagine synthase (glutamine-hydrolysing)
VGPTSTETVLRAPFASDPVWVAPGRGVVSRDPAAFAGWPVDPARIVDALAGLHDAPRRSWWAGVARVPPGWSVTLGPDGARWSEVASHDPKVHPASSVDALRSALARSVARRLPDGPVASLLSGGLDSAAVTYLAARRAPVTALSARFEGFPEADEDAAPALPAGAAWRQVPCGALRQWTDLPPSATPPGSINLVLHAALARSAADAGLHVLLGGSGGDYVVGHGWPMLTGLARRGDVRALLTLARGLARNGHGGDAASIVRVWGVRPLVPGWARRARRGRDVRHAPGWLRPEVVAAHDVEARLARAWAAWADAPPTAVAEHDRLLADPGHATIVEGLTAVCAAYGVSLRLPWLDGEVVAAARAIPEHARLLGGHARGAVREALAGIVPDPVRYRPGKAVFGRWSCATMRRDRPHLERALADLDALAAWVDPDALRLEVRAFLTGDDDRWRAAWVVGSLVPWLRR